MAAIVVSHITGSLATLAENEQVPVAQTIEAKAAASWVFMPILALIAIALMSGFILSTFRAFGGW